MGSKISIQDIDRQAEIYACNDLLRRQFKLVATRGKENKELKKENKELKEEIEELKEYRKIDLEELKNFEKEREQIFTECVKLKNLVEQLRDAIEEPKELDDK